MRPQWFVARSITGLTFAGLLLVALPVAGLMTSAIVRVDRITRATNASATRASEAMQLARSVADALADMERAAGQYAVLGDDRLRRSYLARRSELLDALDQIDGLGISQDHANDAAALRSQELTLYDEINERPVRRAASGWAELGAISDRLLDHSRDQLDAAFEASTQAAIQLRRQLTWQASTALPLTLLLVAFTTRLITRPLSGIDSAIQRLARDEFDQAIAVKGPSDVRRLGQALDMLRLRIQALERQKLTFVRRISHELKTPLTTIRQGAELLADRRGTSIEQTVEIADLLRESSLELQKLIEDLIEYGKAQRFAPQSLVIEAIDLRRVIERVLAERTLAIGSKRIVLVAELEDGIVSGDAKQLRTVVNNLVDNAIKFTPNGGTITVKLRIDGATTCLEVMDTGPGIPEAERDRVFEPFYQGLHQAPGPIKGTGLGLAIARDHVTAHEGRVEVVESSVGAHFRVHLPLLRPPG